MLNGGNAGAVVAVCEEGVDVAADAKDGNGDVDGAELAGCVVEVDVGGKLNVGAAVVAAGVAVLLDVG